MIYIYYQVGRWTSKGKLKINKGQFQVPKTATMDDVVTQLNKLMTKQYSRFTLMGWSSSDTLVG